eukprot:753023-Hanusia_phi.AAC.1
MESSAALPLSSRLSASLTSQGSGVNQTRKETCKLLGRRTSLKAPFRLLALDLHLLLAREASGERMQIHEQRTSTNFAILLFQMMLSRVFSTAVRAVTIRLAPMTMMMAMIIVMGTVLRRMMLLVVVVLGFVIAMSFAMMLLLVMMMAVMSIR